jgi:hypothetical protein
MRAVTTRRMLAMQEGMFGEAVTKVAIIRQMHATEKAISGLEVKRVETIQPMLAIEMEEFG